MSEIVTAATIIAGSGAGGWLADKLLGPSFDELGVQFKAFAGRRLSEIFGAAEEPAKSEPIKALPPGFALQFLQKASFSEDDELITEMWANLLVDAGRSYRPRHALITDILSQLGSGEAIVLDRLVPHDFYALDPVSVPINVRTTVKDEAQRQFSTRCDSTDLATRLANTGIYHRFYWPALITDVALPYTDKGHSGARHLSGGPGYLPAYDALVRQQLLERFETIGANPNGEVRIEGLFVTGLGLELLSACRKRK